MNEKRSDRRVERTRRLLDDALQALIVEKGFEAVSVQEILDKADVGRSTFYAHFSDKEDLLTYGLGKLHGALRAQQQRAAQATPLADRRRFAFSRDVFTHTAEHRDLFALMIGRRSGAVVEQHFQRMLLELVRAELGAPSVQSKGRAAALEAISQHVTGGLVALVRWWVGGRPRLSVDEVDELFQRLVAPALEAADEAR
jgi:AcrR family transcriptional regulator